MSADKTLAEVNAVAKRAAKAEATRLAREAKQAEADAAKLAKQAADAEAKRIAAEEIAAKKAATQQPATWAELEPKVRELERQTAKDDSHRRIVRVALRHPPADALFIGDMGGAPIVQAEDGADSVQWSDGTWQPIVAAEEPA